MPAAGVDAVAPAVDGDIVMAMTLCTTLVGIMNVKGDRYKQMCVQSLVNFGLIMTSILTK
jgi:hypothetical protein